MNRRVLLIDSDPAFRDTLTRELARYKVVVMTEADADRALALANADQPALILLCIEEVDKKAGFRVFEKCKKGSLSKVPIILVTGSVPADSFAKHRNLKVHADEYIDKHTMSTHELVGKIDGLIALGDPDDEEDLSIPLEDEIPMEIAEGDVVLDEVVGDIEDGGEQPTLLAHEPTTSDPEVHDEFDQNEARTVGPQDGLTVDSVVEAETDAAFDALMGGFGDEPEPLPEPEPQAVAEAGEHREESIAMPPVDAELSPVELAVDPSLGEVPEPIMDGRGRGTTPPPLLALSVPGIIIDQPPMRDDHGHAQQIPAIEALPEAIDEAIDEAIPEAVPHQEPGLPAGQFDPAPLEVHDEDSLVADAMSGTIDVGTLADLADAEMPVEPVTHEPVEHEEFEEHTRQATDVYAAHEDVAEDDMHTRLESQPAIMIDDDELVPLDDEVPLEVEVEEPDEPAMVSSPVPRAEHDESTSIAAVPRAPILPEGTPPVDMRTPPRGGSGSHPAIDLGLDVVAQDAQSEQSGVYDRRALRKIGELERQIAQLKVELERARSAGEAAAKGGRESQFLHLRESMLAKDKELKQFKSDLADRESELAEATEKMRQAVAARTGLEAKQAELEKRATDEGTKAQKLTATSKASESQVAQLQQELAATQKAVKDTESARQQLDKELATERATHKASASETERMLRTEREQIAQRHTSELASARTDAEAAKQAAVAHVRDELEATHGAALEGQIEALRRANAAEHEAAVKALDQQHANATVALKADHAGEHSHLKSELGSQISQLEGALAAAKAAHEAAVTSAMGANAAALEQQAEAHLAALARQRTEHAVAIEEQAREHAAAIGETERAHAALLAETTQAAAEAAAERERAVTAATSERDRAIADAKVERDRAIADAKVERDRAIANAKVEIDRVGTNAKVEIDRALAAARAEHDRAMVDLKAAQVAALADKDNAVIDLEVAQVAALADKDSAHADTIAELQQAASEALAEKDEAAGALVRAHATALAANEAAARDQAQRHAAAVAEVQSDLERARAAHEAKLDAAKRELDDTVAKHEQARGEIVEQQRAALAEAVANHERELAKAAADREQLADAARRSAETHRSALADAQAQHAAELQQVAESAGREVAEHKAAAAAARRAIDDATARHTAEREEAGKAHAQAIADTEAKVERQLAIANGEFLKQKSVADAEHVRALAARVADAEKVRTDLLAEHGKVIKETTAERDELKRGLSSARDSLKRSEGELASAVQSIADRNAELRQHAAAVTERDQRIAELRKEIEALEAENTSYQEQVLRAYQKIKTDEAMVARARKAMAIALTVLDDQGNPKET
ncbi:MAG: response regulator [Kofleriaceae bacterium]